MTVPRLAGRCTLLHVVACISAAFAAACGPRTTSEARGTVAAPDTAGVIVSTVTVRAPLELPAQLYGEHDASIVARSAGTVASALGADWPHGTEGMSLGRLESCVQSLR